MVIPKRLSGKPIVDLGREIVRRNAASPKRPFISSTRHCANRGRACSARLLFWAQFGVRQVQAQNGNWSRCRSLQCIFPKPVFRICRIRPLAVFAHTGAEKPVCIRDCSCPLAANSTDFSFSDSGACATRNWNAGLLEWHGGSRNREVLLRAGGHSCDWDQN